MDEIRNVVGDTASERQLVEAILEHKFDFDKALDAILTQATSKPSPPAPSSASGMGKVLSSTASTKEPMETGKN